MKLAQKLAVNYLRARLNLLAVLSEKKAAARAFEIFCTPFQRSNKPAPPIFEKAERVSMTFKGHTVNGYKWNRGGSKRILLLHGFESSSKNFDPYVRALVKKNYEVLAYDAPAHGISPGKKITLPLYIDMIEALYYKSGGIQGFMGHSFGCLAMAHFVEKLPDNQDLKLALIAPASETSTAINSFFRFLQLGAGVRREFEQLILEKNGHPATWFSIPRAMTHIRSSVLWVHDQDDDITPLKDAEPLMKANLPNIAFHITAGLGHKKIYRDAQVIQMVADFL